MRLFLIVLLLSCLNIIWAQINLHSYQTTCSFNPALAGIDSSTRISASYSHYESYGEYLYSDISASTHIKQTRYGISGYFKMYDYFAGVTYFKPVALFF